MAAPSARPRERVSIVRARSDTAIGPLQDSRATSWSCRDGKHKRSEAQEFNWPFPELELRPPALLVSCSRALLQINRLPCLRRLVDRLDERDASASFAAIADGRAAGFDGFDEIADDALMPAGVRHGR